MSGKLVIEALVVGVMTSLIGMAIFYLIMKDDIKDDQWGKVAGILVALGIIIHLLCEVSGINKWYCSNGNACII